MAKFKGIALCLVLLIPPPATAGPEASDARWFYMVKSRPSEPAREDEFNAWYDEIDIPDVLAVPGFDRARRAIVREPVVLNVHDPAYVALYDITTDDIDKSIIDLYVAARKMSQLGRLTDVLKVVEANYYQRIAAVRSHGSGFVFTQKILCCADREKRADYLDWYDSVLEPALVSNRGIGNIRLYELYRIMEVVALGPDEIPHLLLVLEIDATSAADAARKFDHLLASLAGEGKLNELHVAGERLVYEVLSEVSVQ